MFSCITAHSCADKTGFLTKENCNENLFCTKRNNEDISEPSASDTVAIQEVVKQE